MENCVFCYGHAKDKLKINFRVHVECSDGASDVSFEERNKEIKALKSDLGWDPKLIKKFAKT